MERLEQIFKGLEGSPKGKKCAAMEGLIEEGKEIIRDHEKSSFRDAALICAAQKVGQHEINVQAENEGETEDKASVNGKTKKLASMR